MLGVPEYQVEESGPDHQSSFRAVVRVGGQVLGSGEGRTKKAAEQQAAEAAWRAITAEGASDSASRGGDPPRPPRSWGDAIPPDPPGGGFIPPDPPGPGQTPPLAAGNGDLRGAAEDDDGEEPAPER